MNSIRNKVSEFIADQNNEKYLGSKNENKLSDKLEIEEEMNSFIGRIEQVLNDIATWASDKMKGKVERLQNYEVIDSPNVDVSFKVNPSSLNTVLTSESAPCVPKKLIHLNTIELSAPLSAYLSLDLITPESTLNTPNPKLRHFNDAVAFFALQNKQIVALEGPYPLSVRPIPTNIPSSIIKFVEIPNKSSKFVATKRGPKREARRLAAILEGEENTLTILESTSDERIECKSRRVFSSRLTDIKAWKNEIGIYISTEDGFVYSLQVCEDPNRTISTITSFKVHQHPITSLSLSPCRTSLTSVDTSLCVSTFPVSGVSGVLSAPSSTQLSVSSSHQVDGVLSALSSSELLLSTGSSCHIYSTSSRSLTSSFNAFGKSLLLSFADQRVCALRVKAQEVEFAEVQHMGEPAHTAPPHMPSEIGVLAVVEVDGAKLGIVVAEGGEIEVEVFEVRF